MTEFNKLTVGIAVMTLIFTAIMSGSPANGEEKNALLKKGDKWAMGAEEDFSHLFDEIAENYTKEINGEAQDFVNYTYNNEGNVGFYYTSEVLDNASGMYKVRSEEAFYIHTYTESTFKFKALPVEGNHTNVTEKDSGMGTEWNGVSTAQKTVKVQMGIDLVVKTITTNYYLQNTMNLDHTNISFFIGAKFIFAGENIPEFLYGNSSYNSEDDSTTYEWMDVSYSNPMLKGKVSMDFNLNLAFDPAVNLFDLPINEGDVWNGTTNVAVSGDIGGIIDIEKPRDVPLDMLQEFYGEVNNYFSEGGINKTISKWSDLFPIYIPNEWLPVDELGDNITIENNRFVLSRNTIPEPLDYSFTTGEKRNVTLPNGTVVETYEIVPSTENEAWESGARDGGYDGGSDAAPVDVRFFVDPETGKSMEAEARYSDQMTGSEVVLTTKPVKVADAEKVLNDKADPDHPEDGGVNTGRTFGFAGSEGGSGGSTPFPGVPLLTAAVFVGSILYLKRRKVRD